MVLLMFYATFSEWFCFLKSRFLTEKLKHTNIQFYKVNWSYTLWVPYLYACSALLTLQKSVSPPQAQSCNSRVQTSPRWTDMLSHMRQMVYCLRETVGECRNCCLCFRHLNTNRRKETTDNTQWWVITFSCFTEVALTWWGNVTQGSW